VAEKSADFVVIPCNARVPSVDFIGISSYNTARPVDYVVVPLDRKIGQIKCMAVGTRGSAAVFLCVQYTTRKDSIESVVWLQFPWHAVLD